MENEYRTIARKSPEILYKDRKSKFYAQAFPIESESEVAAILEAIRDAHKGAGHVCYAWRLGLSGEHYRANDDGEPANSAGMPIYGQIRALDITQVLVTVAREFGGVKLGVGGLIQAYKTAAKLALDEASVVVRQVKETLQIDFEYPDMDKVMRSISQIEAEIVKQDMSMSCSLIIRLPKSRVAELEQMLSAHHKVVISDLNQEANG